MVVETPLEGSVPSKEQTPILVYFGKKGPYMGCVTKKMLCRSWLVLLL